MQEQATKVKKKQWYQIIAPNQFDNVVIGETLVYDPQAMIGKSLSQSLFNLTNDIKRQNVNIHFKVVGVEENKGKASIIGYEIIPSSVKRFVRRNSEKADLSFSCETSDNIFLRVKPLVITRADVKGSIAAKLRNNIVQFLIRTIKRMTYEELMRDMISHKLQMEMRSALNKIYPLKVCEIRYVGVVQREKPREEKIEAKVEIQEEK